VLDPVNGIAKFSTVCRGPCPELEDGQQELGILILSCPTLETGRVVEEVIDRDMAI
jgi:hypothetical protein